MAGPDDSATTLTHDGDGAELSSPESVSSLDTLDDLDPLPVPVPDQSRPSLKTRILGRLGLVRDAAPVQLAYEMGVERRKYKSVPAHGDALLPIDTASPTTSGTELNTPVWKQDPESERTESSWSRPVWISLAIIVPSLLLLLGAYSTISPKTIPPSTAPLLYYNGTSWFGATTILISLDGFRADFLHRGLTPTLNSFIRKGVSPRWMLPSFPSLTFPNHWTLATGLHPETHGIVANSFWDPALGQKFGGANPKVFLEPQWWLGESIWETAEKAGLRTAIHMWPGSEVVRKVEPSYVDMFNGDELLENKVSRILGLLDLPGRNDSHAIRNRPRPEFIAAYVPNVDADGHLFGPNSTEIHETIRQVDSMLGSLFQGLEQRNLTNIINVIIVSDHGMATTSTSRLVHIDDIIDMSLIQDIDGWPHYGLRPKDPNDLDKLYQKLKSYTDTHPNPGFDVYLRDKTMPERYHFSSNDRIAPLWVIPHVGWAIVTGDPFSDDTSTPATTDDLLHDAVISDADIFHPRGIHGYDNHDPLMRSIFIARGPAFPHPGGSKIDVFQNIHVYNIVCDSLGIQPVDNNGTLRLPLDVKGRHGVDPPGEIPDDLPD